MADEIQGGAGDAPEAQQKATSIPNSTYLL